MYQVIIYNQSTKETHYYPVPDAIDYDDAQYVVEQHLEPDERILAITHDDLESSAY
jgi:hypothetical protein